MGYVAENCMTPGCSRVPHSDGECWRCPACDAKRDSETEKLRDLCGASYVMLKALEWSMSWLSPVDNCYHSRCPFCGAMENSGKHYECCTLMAMLQKLKEVEGV